MSTNKYKPTSVSTSTPSRRKQATKTGGYCSTKLHARRDKRREEAEVRRCLSESRNTSERMALLRTRRGLSQRERMRLVGQVAS